METKISFALLLCLSCCTSVNALIGKPLPCTEEGSQIQVSSAVPGASSCVVCFCKNYIVQCEPTNCPSVAGCYRVQKNSSPECCKTCLGCSYGDDSVPHGHSWVDDKCRAHQCQAGVLTTTQPQCHVPCAVPVPQKSGQCCPTCQGCWLEGRLLAEGETAAPHLDPCVRCVCVDGRLSCVKRACPVLSCPSSKASIGSDGCCPVCNGSMDMFALPGGRCFLGSFLYLSGSERTLDECTTCACHDGFLACERQTCAPVRCPQRYQKTERNHCCSSCVYPAQVRVCRTGGVIRAEGERWSGDRCSTCQCEQGQVTCHAQICHWQDKECQPGMKKIQKKEDCCPRCIRDTTPAICTAYGLSHYETFDGYKFDFDGECRYELARACGKSASSFSLRISNGALPSSTSHRFTSSRSSRSLIMKIGRKYKVSLGQRLRTKVNRKRVRLPYETPEGELTIKRNGFLVSLNTSIGISVSWDGARFVEVVASGLWRNHTCGLCGNFNGTPKDDLLMRRGQLASTAAQMAASWRAMRAQACARKLKAQRRRQRAHSGGKRRTQRLSHQPASVARAKHKCAAVMNVTALQQCQLKVAVKQYEEWCAEDLSVCPRLRPSCECDSLSVLVRRCQHQGVSVHGWREATTCGGFNCPVGSVYKRCAPSSCRASCANPTPSLDCYMRRCEPGCFCPPPTVLHRGACIIPQFCPKSKRNKRKRKHYKLPKP